MGAVGPTPEKFRPILELGRGGMATVYLAVVRGPGGFQKLTVIKRLRRDVVAEAPEMLTMFLDEARLAARINHPNVVQTNEVGDDAAHHFIAMEYLDGQPLRAIMREAGARFPLPIHLRILCDVLAGLHAAHELKDFGGAPLSVVHRDVSPHNVIVTYTGVAKLVDFGIAKTVDSSAETRSGVIKGKYSYMAPEQFIEGGKSLDRRADIYAAGVLLWQALVGAIMWPRGTEDAEIFRRVTEGDIPRPSSRKPDVPPELEAVCMKALSLRRDDRFATAAEMQAPIERYLSKLDPRTTADDVGRFVAELFAEERAALNAVIDMRINDNVTGSFPLPHLHSIVPASAPSSPSLASGSAIDHTAVTKSLGTSTATRVERARRKPWWNRLAIMLPVALVAAVAIKLLFSSAPRGDTSPRSDVASERASTSADTASAPAPASAVVMAPVAPVASASASVAPVASASTSASPVVPPIAARPGVVAAPIATPKTAKSAAPVDTAGQKRKPKVDEADPWK